MLIDANSAVFAICCMKHISVSLKFILLFTCYLCLGSDVCCGIGTLHVFSLAAVRPKSAHHMCLNSCLVLGENMAQQLELWKRPDSWASSSVYVWWWQHCWWVQAHLATLGPAAAWAPAAFSGVRRWGSPGTRESPRLPLCQCALRAWCRAVGEGSNHPVLDCKCVEYRLPFISVWGFFSVYLGFCYVCFSYYEQWGIGWGIKLESCCLTTPMWKVISSHELATSLCEGDQLCCCTGGLPEYPWEEEHRYNAWAGSQLLGKAGALWMEYVTGLAAGSPDVPQVLLLPLQKIVIDIRCMACEWKCVYVMHFQV